MVPARELGDKKELLRTHLVVYAGIVAAITGQLGVHSLKDHIIAGSAGEREPQSYARRCERRRTRSAIAAVQALHVRHHRDASRLRRSLHPGASALLIRYSIQ